MMNHCRSLLATHGAGNLAGKAAIGSTSCLVIETAIIKFYHTQYTCEIQL
jgi:tagatose-1,6-bisphosphate aldolase non-catalytic subunit AgaZ/GatZ